jgi:uncharacterized protein YecE (DUF72 family)
MKVWLGTAGWSYLPDWVGPFYPPGTSASDALGRYCEAFRFVEVDATFYAPPGPTTIERWANIVPSSHRISFKAPRELVQETALRPPDVPFGHFCGTLVDALGERVAAFVVQMPPSFARTPTNELSLRVFAQQWGPVFPLAVELRHASWRTAATAEILSANNVTWASNDLHDVPDLGPGAHNTNRWAYVRLIGHHDGLAKDRIQRPQDAARAWWRDRLLEFSLAGTDHVYVVVNNHYEGHAPSTLRTLASELAGVGLDVIASPGWPDGQASLF